MMIIIKREEKKRHKKEKKEKNREKKRKEEKKKKKKKNIKNDENDSRCVSSIPCLPMHWTCIMANASNFKQDHVLIPMRQKRHIAYK